MSWSSDSVRHSELPSNWDAIREFVLEDEHYTCRRCGKRANQVDHIRNWERNNHSRDNLQALCAKCHGQKTALEAKLARYGLAKRRGQRHWEPHPGIKQP